MFGILIPCGGPPAYRGPDVLLAIGCSVTLRGIALGRKAWRFAGSDRGARRAAFMYTLIISAKLNAIDPQAWLADVLSHRRHAAEPAGAGAPAPLELDASGHGQGGLTMPVK